MKKIVLILSAYCSLSICAGQSPADREKVHYTLTEFLKVIESEYQVSFSYVDEVVAGKTISYHVHGLSTLSAILKSLQRQTVLNYQQFGENYIVVRPFEQTDTLSISGTLMELDGTPIVGAVVITGGQTRGAVSDTSGYFNIDKVSFGTLVSIHHLSYQIQNLYVQDFIPTDTLQIVLESANQVLEELIISDYLTVGITKERKDLTLFPSELKILPGLTEPDLLQSLQQSPGVFSPYETATGLHVRGGSPDQNLVLWNGIKTYGQGHFFGMLSAFNPYTTSEVNFIKHGTSSEYGDRVSSVIEIKSDESIPTRVEGGAGSNLLYSDVFLRVPIIRDKLMISGSARRSFTDLYESVTYRQLSSRVFQNTKITSENTASDNQKNAFFFKDFTGNIVYKPTDVSKLSFNSLYNRDDLDFISGNGNETYQDVLFTSNNGFNANYEHQLGINTRIEASAYYTKYLLQYEFRTTSNDTTDVASKKNLVQDLGGSLATTYQWPERHQLKVGVQTSNVNIRYAFENFTPTYRLILDSDNPIIQTYAVFSEYQYQTSNTFASFGARWNHYSSLSKSYLEPRLYVQQQVYPQLRLSASGEFRTQTASQIKESVVSDLSLENQVWTQASEGKFPVIKSYQGTFGISYNRLGWLLDVEGYRKNLSGVTTLTFGFLNPINNEFRRGESKIYGADVFLKKQFDRYKTWLGYTYLHTQNKFTGINNDKAFPGNWNIQHTLRWSHFYEVKKFQFSLGWILHTGKSYTEVSTAPSEGGPITIQFGELNGTNLPVYHRLDFSAIYETTSRLHDQVRYRIGLSVLNAYGRKNILNREFRTTPSLENELIDTRVYSLKITPNVTFRVFW